ncbi:hypothetical protein JOS77_17745 [Chromobacterium haemolyticum]|nr:hypothetical protein JOS77_17745 [Chromobacterium haemolyticum]
MHGRPAYAQARGGAARRRRAAALRGQATVETAAGENVSAAFVRAEPRLACAWLRPMAAGRRC